MNFIFYQEFFELYCYCTKPSLYINYAYTLKRRVKQRQGEQAPDSLNKLYFSQNVKKSMCS